MEIPKFEYRFKLEFTGFGTSNTLPLSQNVLHFKRPILNFSDKCSSHSYEPVTVFLRDDEENAVQELIEEQVVKQMTTSGYKFELSCDSLDGNAKILEHWNFKNCSVQTVNYGDNDYRVSSPVAIQLVISFNGADHILYQDSRILHIASSSDIF